MYIWCGVHLGIKGDVILFFWNTPRTLFPPRKQNFQVFLKNKYKHETLIRSTPVLEKLQRFREIAWSQFDYLLLAGIFRPEQQLTVTSQ